MKHLILVIAVLLLTACGTVHRVTEKLQTKHDTSSHVKLDSLSVIKRDSSGHKEDHSTSITKEHIVNTISQPGDTLIGSAKLKDLLNWHKALQVADSAATVILSYDSADSSVTATVYQKAKVLRQVIDRTIENHSAITDDFKSEREDSIKTTLDKKTKSHVDTDKKTIDKKVTGLQISWRMYVALGLCALIASAFVLIHLYTKEKL